MSGVDQDCLTYPMICRGFRPPVAREGKLYKCNKDVLCGDQPIVGAQKAPNATGKAIVSIAINHTLLRSVHN